MGNEHIILDDLITVPSAAGQLGVCKMTLYRWINEHKIDAIKVGGIFMVPTREIERVKAGKHGR